MFPPLSVLAVLAGKVSQVATVLQHLEQVVAVAVSRLLVLTVQALLAVLAVQGLMSAHLSAVAHCSRVVAEEAVGLLVVLVVHRLVVQVVAQVLEVAQQPTRDQAVAVQVQKYRTVQAVAGYFI
jgi:hypothetical protein